MRRKYITTLEQMSGRAHAQEVDAFIGRIVASLRARGFSEGDADTFAMKLYTWELHRRFGVADDMYRDLAARGLADGRYAPHGPDERVAGCEDCRIDRALFATWAWLADRGGAYRHEWPSRLLRQYCEMCWSPRCSEPGCTQRTHEHGSEDLLVWVIRFLVALDRAKVENDGRVVALAFGEDDDGEGD